MDIKISFRDGIKLKALVLFLCILLTIVTGYAKADFKDNIIYCVEDFTPIYSMVIARLLPNYQVLTDKSRALTHVSKGHISEATDVQAYFMLKEGLVKYWYPQYEATVVITVDRDMTDVEISGWQDLMEIEVPVSVFLDAFDGDYILSAISYGLEGKNYKVDSAVELLSSLRKKNLLETKNFHSSILICYDYQAIALIKENRNLEIIIPAEGTLSYVKGLLSNSEITLAENIDSKLISAGLRLPDGRSDLSLYPKPIAYEKASLIDDYEYFGRQALNMDRAIRRKILGLHRTSDSREHLFFTIMFTIVVLIWVATVINRAIQKSVRRGAIMASLFLIGWIVLRLLKWQATLEGTMVRYLWFTYVPFQLLISLLLLWISWKIDKPDDMKLPTIFMYPAIITNLLLTVMVFTNDIHNLVYSYDLSVPGWSRYAYSYGIGYYIALIVQGLQLLAAITILVGNCIRNPRKRKLFYPLILFSLAVAYGYGYISRIPIVRESDFVMVFGILAILFFQGAISSGMIPTNIKYRDFFIHSPLSMQILDDKGEVLIASKTAKILDDSSISYILSGLTLPLQIDEDTLLFFEKIIGGYAVWHEDISMLNKLHRLIQNSIKNLISANAILEKKAKLMQQMEEEKARSRLMEDLEKEVYEIIKKLQAKIRRLPNAKNNNKERAVIAMMFCYIKRRSDLFFSEQETRSISASELIIYTDEFSEYASMAGTNIQTINEIKDRLFTCQLTLFYDFFVEVVLWATAMGYSNILARFYTEENYAAMGIMLPDKDNIFKPEKKLKSKIQEHNGIFAVKDLDDVIGISLSLPLDANERGDCIA